MPLTKQGSTDGIRRLWVGRDCYSLWYCLRLGYINGDVNHPRFEF
nr:MAG TPA: hypothetical protein [Caudoviricetes sp.]